MWSEQLSHGESQIFLFDCFLLSSINKFSMDIVDKYNSCTQKCFRLSWLVAANVVFYGLGKIAMIRDVWETYKNSCYWDASLNIFWVANDIGVSFLEEWTHALLH